MPENTDFTQLSGRATSFIHSFHLHRKVSPQGVTARCHRKVTPFIREPTQFEPFRP
jgi:hypothetical protein